MGNVLLGYEGAVAVLTLSNSPSNCLTTSMFRQLGEHMESLEAPGMKVSGVSLPGMPGIISGHNDRIAWGETSLEFDVQDLYIEKLDLRTGQYLFNGKIEQARSERA